MGEIVTVGDLFKPENVERFTLLSDAQEINEVGDVLGWVDDLFASYQWVWVEEYEDGGDFGEEVYGAKGDAVPQGLIVTRI